MIVCVCVCVCEREREREREFCIIELHVLRSIFILLSILGGVVVIVGLYLLLWGKEGDQEQPELKEQSLSPCEECEDPKGLIFTSAGKDMKEP